MTDFRKERKEQIIKVAIKTFGKNNFHKTKMADIAKEAQMGKSTIYEYFDSKINLFEETLIYLLTSYYESMEIEINKEHKSRDKLISFTAYHASFMKDNLDLVESAMIDRTAISEDVGWKILEKKKKVYDLLENIFIEGVKSGEFLSDLDTQLASSTLIGSINYSYTMQMCASDKSIEGIDPESIVNLLYKGFGNTSK